MFAPFFVKLNRRQATGALSLVDELLAKLEVVTTIRKLGSVGGELDQLTHLRRALWTARV